MTILKRVNNTTTARKEQQIKISFVIVHTFFRDGIHSLPNDLGYIVLSSYNNGNEMTFNFPTVELPDVVLVDANGEKSAALKAVGWIKAHHESAKILALSLEAEESAVNRFLDIGAHGYVCKAAEPPRTQCRHQNYNGKEHVYTDVGPMAPETLLKGQQALRRRQRL